MNITLQHREPHWTQFNILYSLRMNTQYNILIEFNKSDILPQRKICYILYVYINIYGIYCGSTWTR